MIYIKEEPPAPTVHSHLSTLAFLFLTFAIMAIALGLFFIIKIHYERMRAVGSFRSYFPLSQPSSNRPLSGAPRRFWDTLTYRKNPRSAANTDIMLEDEFWDEEDGIPLDFTRPATDTHHATIERVNVQDVYRLDDESDNPNRL